MLCAPIALLLVLSPGQTTSQNKGPDVIKGRHLVRGRVVGFETGDFVHVIIRGPGKHTDSYFIGGFLLDDFMAANVKKLGTFKIETVDCYIEQAGDREVIDRVSDAKIGDVTLASWVKQQHKHLTDDQIMAKYQPLVDKLTVSPK